MMPRADLEFAAKTDTGRLRSQNEDAIAASPQYGFVVLADGMGGYNAGEVASGIAVHVIKEALEKRLRDEAMPVALTETQARAIADDAVVASVLQANRAILDAAAAEPGYAGMGTTLVVAAFRQQHATIAHVGDSRAYLFRNGELTQLTRDHSVVQEQIDAGLLDAKDASSAHHRNLVTRAVGVTPTIEVEVHAHTTRSGDIYLLCSDGLSDMLTPTAIADILMLPDSLQSRCEALVQAANDAGGIDNISVVLVGVRGMVAPAGGLIAHLKNWTKLD